MTVLTWESHFLLFGLILSVSFSPCQASCRPVRSPFPHLTPFWPRNSRYDAQAHDISHFGCISLVFKRRLWKRLFRSYRSWQGFPRKLIHYIYIQLTFLCRLLYSPSGNTNPYSSISSVARNPFWNSNVAWAYYSMDRSLGHQQSFWPRREHQMRMNFQSSVPWYALIVWWMYWVCWVEAVMLGASKEAHIM